MSKALMKNTVREIKGTLARFISILMIVALGVGFFVGVKATSPSMKQMAASYYDETNLMDFRLVSTVGFDDYDINAVKSTAGVASVMPSYFSDVMINSNGSGSIVRLMGTPSKYKSNEVLNNPVVIEGHMPEKKGEIAVENGKFSDYKIGDTLTIEPNIDDTDVGEIINTLSYKVVGIVQSPMYISFERGTTTVGNGKVSGYAFIANESFDIERYTELYVTVRGTDINPFTDEYKETVKKLTQRLENTADERVSVFVRDNIELAQKEINDNKEKLSQEKENADKELKKAKSNIDKAEKEYNSKMSLAQSQIDSAQSKIDEGASLLKTQKDTYNASVEQFNKQINAAKAELDNSKKELKKQYDEFYNNTKPQLEETKVQLEQGIAATASSTVYGIISQIPAGALDEETLTQLNLAAENITYENARQTLENISSLLPPTLSGVVGPAIESSLAVIDELQTNLDQVNTALTEGESQLALGKATLDNAQKELDKKEKETLEKLSQAKAQLDSAEDEIQNGRLKLEQSRAELDDAKMNAKDMIDKGKADYKKSKKEAEDKFKEANDKIDEAQAELDKVEEPKWYVFDRDDNPGYSTFVENSNRVDAVSTVFPVFFLLVAMLVCLTTMTRLVEEKRTQIGTLKALGYSDKDIILKFVIYSSLAALLGCILGCSLGIPILPRVIYNAYKMMYTMQDIRVIIPWGSFILAVFAAFVCCAFVSFVVCKKALRHKPSSLMRPKAPKPGKRILLERITPLWRRLSFTSKVTGRNLFRYKARFWMTVIGIAGCTALILSAFGLYDAINDVVGLQYNELCSYNTILVTNGDGSKSDFDTLLSDINNDDRISDSMLFMQKTTTVASDTDSVNEDVHITVPADEDSIDGLIKLRDRKTKRSIKLEDSKVVVTEKLADMLNVSQGDTVYLSDDRHAVVVSDICENYVYNYIYMTENTYEKLFSEDIGYNMVLIKAKNISDEVEKSIGSDYLSKEDISAVSFMSSGIKNFEDMMNSMNLVIVVLIVCAGALAIVVLYNLTNINLAERSREIATIKVLGFNYRETASFLYRENIIMTIIGIAVGLVVGIWLCDYMIVTIEVDSVMFGRSIYPMSFVYAAVGTAFFSFIVNTIMYFKMKTIDMVESLKSIE